jgi:hypothetical protein
LAFPFPEEIPTEADEFALVTSARTTTPELEEVPERSVGGGAAAKACATAFSDGDREILLELFVFDPVVREAGSPFFETVAAGVPAAAAVSRVETTAKDLFSGSPRVEKLNAALFLDSNEKDSALETLAAGTPPEEPF